MSKSAPFSFDEFLKRITHSDDFELSQIIQAVVKRYQDVFPDWEVVFLSMPKNNPEVRMQTLTYILRREDLRSIRREMSEEQKRRFILLQAFLETDPDYEKYLQATLNLDGLLMELNKELTDIQMAKVIAIQNAYMQLADQTASTACKYMIFRSEIK